MIHISAAAEAEFKRRLAQASTRNIIRIGVEPGGCAAWHYTLQPAAQTDPDDQQFKYTSFQIIATSDLLALIDGLTIDYSEDLMGGSFRFINPNAVQTCGCSSSFTMDPQDDISEDCTQPSQGSGKAEVDIMKDKMVP